LKVKHYVLLALLLIFLFSFIWGLTKPLPDGVSFQGQLHNISNDSISFLGDITYQQNNKSYVNQTLFETIFRQISEAKEFIVVDMFLFTNEYYNNSDLIPLANLLTQQLVLATDHFNTLYGSQKPDHIMVLENASIPLIYTNVNKLRNSNPLYSSIWDVLLRVFGIPNYDANMVSNIITSEPKHMGVRSFFKLLNFKANHRKVLLTEDTSFFRYLIYRFQEWSGLSSF
jgi:cardiolipin synthase